MQRRESRAALRAAPTPLPSDGENSDTSDDTSDTNCSGSSSGVHAVIRSGAASSRMRRVLGGHILLLHGR